MFVELHAQSAFSFLEGTEQPETLVAEAARLGMPTLALVDRDGLYGAPRFYHAAVRAGLKPLVGSELTLSDGSRLPLLVEDREGYQNLCRLITRMKLAAPKGEAALALDDLEPYAPGLVCLTGGGRGPLARRLAAGDWEAARASLDRLVGIFGRSNCFVEVQRHFDREEERTLEGLVGLARAARVPLVATNQPLYARPGGRAVADVFTCIREKTDLDHAGRQLTVNGERGLRAETEMVRAFRDLPEALHATGELALRLGFTLKDLGYRFPDYPRPPGQSPHRHLEELVAGGVRQRYGTGPLAARARRQVVHELSIIGRLDLAGYFLIVWDIVEFCRANGILVQGRGSAANSAVCYALGITAVDPVKMDLLFERFLSEARGEWPDIDLDLPSGERREAVIQYVYRRYGRLGAGMTANVITYRGRSAAREVGKALGLPADMQDRLACLAPSWGYQDPDDLLTKHLAEAGCDPRHPRIRTFAALWTRIQDLPRHLGQHSGGMVIAAGRLDAIVPLEPATMPGRVVIQWDKDDCAAFGIIKIDLLGLRMMSVLQEAIELVREGGGDVDLAHLPEDPAIYRMLQGADTIGVFQVESRAQMATLPRIHPERFYDLVVQVAIIRPGPIVGDMVHPYIRRRRGREPVTYPHPSLEPILERTLGVPLFQEQLLRMAMVAAGFTGTEAEELRRAFGFKRSEQRMKEVEVKLRAGMAGQGITGQAAEQIVHAITSFALYGFPESHASSFALLAYASAYLKARHPAAFYAALLNNQPMGFYHAATIVKDAQRHGLRILPIDVTRSEWLCTTENLAGSGARDIPRSENPTSLGTSPAPDPHESSHRHVGRDASRAVGGSEAVADGAGVAVRLGLRYVKGLRESAGRAIVATRAPGPFSSPHDLARRAGLEQDELAALAAIGALNTLGGTRRANLWVIAAPALPELLVGGESASPARSGDEPSEAPSGSAPHPLREMNAAERLAADYAGTGVTLGPHPLALRRRALARRDVVRARDLAGLPHGQWVRVAGSVIVRQRPGTAKGFVFLSLEDETGIANVIVTPQLFARQRLTLVAAPFLLVGGILQKQDEVISVRAVRVEALPGLSPHVPSHDFG
ncbi:MAG TPA: error-prone DNA polymerase [Methylomirabilota bacterium]|jgi:error-prone DNA polymerase|nr:error-prone DNA polymerase [Methylomirabilota bacterium]